uniref:Prolyl 3-hydroxylase sudestada1 n=1 Tax=Diabrotica virgifera virgifera TaxID=50390 RepID=A0A6P7FK15_DIAVI
MTSKENHKYDEDSDNDYTSEESSPDDANYFEESSGTEPETECELWDHDCKVIPNTPSSLIGYHLMPTCSRDPDKIPQKKLKISAEIHKNLVRADFFNDLKDHWSKDEKLSSPDVEIITEPFKVCVINKFIDNEDVLDNVRQEFNELDWNMRNMDLYEFFQSKDLKYLSSDYINAIFNFLKEEAMEWVANLTGYSLTHISATCSLYSNTDYLLVHDDQREDRMVAFVLYLTGKNGWNESKGGALQLFNKSETGQPQVCVRNIFPANNQLVLFPVTSDSYHQRSYTFSDTQWISFGPPNRYCYEKIDMNNLPHVLERFLDLFQSSAMFSLLEQYTDLELSRPNASMKFELQRWTCGNYTLLSDFDWDETIELDLIVYFGCEKSSDVIGARTQYVTIEDEIQNALITLEPEENNLNVVYRDTARFTKYFSKQSKCKKFYTLVCSYSE